MSLQEALETLKSFCELYELYDEYRGIYIDKDYEATKIIIEFVEAKLNERASV